MFHDVFEFFDFLDALPPVLLGMYDGYIFGHYQIVVLFSNRFPDRYSWKVIKFPYPIE